jgi:hypothetical protein
MSGALHAFFKNARTPSVLLLHTLNNPNAYGTSANDFFGGSIAISGNYAIVGAYAEDDAGGSDSGKAYIFDVTTGALVHTLNNPNAYGTSAGENGFGDAFGYSVAISGNYAILGVYNEGPNFAGKAYIFNVTTGALVHTLSGTSNYGGFGRSVNVSGNYCIVGAYGESDAGGQYSGRAYIFNVTTGTLVHTLNNPNAYGTSASDFFGTTSSISGNYCIVGAYGESDAGGTTSGKAYIYNVTTGALVHTLSNPNAYGTSVEDYFSYPVTISGNYAIVSATYEDDAGGTGSGKVYIYNVTSGTLLYTLTNPNAYGTSADDNFGGAISASGNYCIIGAYGEDDAGGTTSGKAYIYNLTNGALLHTINNLNAYGTSANDFFGINVAIADNYVIIGALEEDDAGGTNSGKAYIYKM